MKEKNKREATLRDVNDETPDNFTRMGNGHTCKEEEKYTDGEPPSEDDEKNAPKNEQRDRTHEEYP